HGCVAKPFERALPELDRPRNVRILRQATIRLGVSNVVEDVDDAGAADAGRVVNASVREVVMLLQLLGAGVRELQHVVLRAEMQTAGGAGLNASRLEVLRDAIRAQRALVDALGFLVEFGDIEWAAADAIAAANALILLEIDDAVSVLHDSAIGRACFQAARLGAVHALILAH